MQRYQSILVGWILIVPFWLVHSAHAQSKLTENTLRLEDSSQAGRATLADVQWLQGLWRGQGLGGNCEEFWSPAEGGSMVGTFRLIKDDKLVFSEFFMLVEENDSLVLKLKHFDPQFHGWETKDQFVTFRLVKIEDKTAWFDRLTYRINDDGSMNAIVVMKQKDGTLQEAIFTYRK